MFRIKSVLVLIVLLMLPVFAADPHFIQDDEYFISEQEFKNADWIYVAIAKMIEPASPKTKNEAKFLRISDGKEIWTKNFWKTRPAGKTDIKIGTVVIMAEISGDNDIYIAPQTKEEARENSWFMAKITDTSDLYKNFVSVSGGYKAAVNNLRIEDAIKIDKIKIKK